MKKIALISLLLFVIAACSAEVEEEVIEEEPVEEVEVEKDPSVLSFNEMTMWVNYSLDDVTKFYTLTSPDEQVTFSISSDLAFTSPYDYTMVIDATVFIDAGLDVSLLAEGLLVDNKLVYGYELVNANTQSSDVVSAFEAIFTFDPSLVGYHESLDHYGLSFGNGNVFEWASDFSTNDKDLVFVLNPQPFIDAGVDVNIIEGWTFALVEVMDEDGNMVMVDKLLKPFDINLK